MIILCIYSPSVQFDFVWSTRYSPVFLSVSALPCLALPCLALPCLDTLKAVNLELYPRLRVPGSSLVCAS